MKIKRIDHIAIAVEDAKEIAHMWTKILGIEIEKEEILENNGVKIIIMKVKEEADQIGTKIEMMEPYGEKSPINNFIKKRGRGIHHICFVSEDLESDIKELKKKGIKLLKDEPIEGADGSLIIFIDPKEFGGILVELKQLKK